MRAKLGNSSPLGNALRLQRRKQKLKQDKLDACLVQVPLTASLSLAFSKKELYRSDNGYQH
jgi:hypothetical protein